MALPSPLPIDEWYMPCCASADTELPKVLDSIAGVKYAGHTVEPENNMFWLWIEIDKTLAGRLAYSVVTCAVWRANEAERKQKQKHKTPPNLFMEPASDVTCSDSAAPFCIYGNRARFLYHLVMLIKEINTNAYAMRRYREEFEKAYEPKPEEEDNE